MTRHIHADLMIQAANDIHMEWERLTGQGNWIPTIPTWKEGEKYRKRPEPHPHQALMDIAAADPSIEWQYKDHLCGWTNCHNRPSWNPDSQYRQKPVEPVMVEMWQWSFKSRVSDRIFASTEYHADKPVDSVSNSSVPVCRIEGSKITIQAKE